MYGLLKGKKGIIFGAVDERSIAWYVALACAAEGASFVLTNTEAACKIGNINRLAEERNATLQHTIDDLKKQNT